MPLIESGMKSMTIRKDRANPIKTGDKLFLYTGMRTKDCNQIANAECINVKSDINSG